MTDFGKFQQKHVFKNGNCLCCGYNEDDFLLEEIAKTDHMVIEFTDKAKEIIKHIDNSNDPKFSMLKDNLREFLEEANLMEPKE